MGVEWGNKYRISSWLAAELNAAVTRGRFDSSAAPDDLGCGDAAPAHLCAQDVGIVGRYIPNSPSNVIDGGFTAQRESGLFGAVHARTSAPPPW